MNQIQATTTDTAETVTAPDLPVADRTGDGYDYMDTLRAHGWRELSCWGRDGWDLGDWPYVIIAVHVSTTGDGGKLCGVGSYCEGDTDAQYFRTREGFHDAITRHAFSSWRLGHAQGPAASTNGSRTCPRSTAPLPLLAH